MVTILNCAILTSFGVWDYKPISLDDAKTLVSTGFESAAEIEKIGFSWAAISSPNNQKVTQ